MSIEFDNDKEAIINPFGFNDKKIPPVAISCYTQNTIDSLIQKYDGELLGKVSKTLIYKIKYEGKEYTTFLSPIGAPWATMVLEDLISIGLKKIIYFGTCGILDNTNEYEILIPTKSKREEGTSYHYIKGKKYININPKYRKDFIKLLNKEELNYKLCKTWTTDAPYRETKSKVKKYLDLGITCVDMESSALATIGTLRNVDVFIFFYAADKLESDKWNKRCLGNKDAKKLYFGELALKFASLINK